MVEWRDDRQPALGGKLPRNRFAVARDAVVEYNLCAIVARRVHFDLRRIRRHDDGRGDAQHLGGQRQPLCVVARRKRHDAALPLLRRQLRERIVRAAKLERARPLQVFALEECTASGDLVKRARGDDGRAVRLPAQPLGGGLDIGEGDDTVLHFAHSAKFLTIPIKIR